MKALAFVSDSGFFFLSWSPSSLFVPLTAEAKWPYAAPRCSHTLSSQHKAKMTTKAAGTKEIISPSADKRGVPKRLVHPPLLSLLRWSVSPKGQTVQPDHSPGFVLKAIPPISNIFMLLILPNSGLSIMYGKENGFMANKAGWKTDFLTRAYL